MVKHIILWQLKEELQGEEKEKVKAGIKAGLEGLAGQIPGVDQSELHWHNAFEKHLSPGSTDILHENYLLGRPLAATFRFIAYQAFIL